MNRTNKRAEFARILAAAALFLAISQAAAPAQTTRERQLEARDHVNQGNFMMGQNHYAEAIEEYKKALEIDPTNSIAKDNIVTCHINWGNYYVRQRKYPEALKEYQTCLILNPYNAKAMNNIKVVKATMARDTAAAAARAEQSQGKTDEEKGAAPAKASAAPKKEQPSAVILTPGIKASSGSSSGSGESPTPTASYGEGSESQPAAKIIPPAESPGAAPAATPPTRPAAPPPPHPAGANQSAGPATGSLEDLLSAVEIKIYGHKQPDMPVLKRLEKLEMDTAGSIRTGTIKERIDFLRKNYGL